MKITVEQIKKIIKEEIAIIGPLSHDHAQAAGVEVNPSAALNGVHDKDKVISEFLAKTRMLYLWFHGAHHCAKGVAFIPDHKDIYGEIYGDMVDVFDTLVEKAIVMAGNESVACPIALTRAAAKMLDCQPTPCGCDAESIAKTALSILNDYYCCLENTFDTLDEAGNLGLGMNDFLSSIASDLDTYIYLLTQRTKRSY